MWPDDASLIDEVSEVPWQCYLVEVFVFSDDETAAGSDPDGDLPLIGPLDIASQALAQRDELATGPAGRNRSLMDDPR